VDENEGKYVTITLTSVGYRHARIQKYMCLYHLLIIDRVKTLLNRLVMN